MKNLKTILFFVTFNFIVYLVSYISLRIVGDDQAFGWVLLNLYIYIPIITIFYFIFLVAIKKVNITVKALLFIFNIILYHTFIFIVFGYHALTDSFAWSLVLVPSLLGVSIGSIIYMIRSRKN